MVQIARLKKNEGNNWLCELYISFINFESPITFNIFGLISDGRAYTMID